MSLSTPFSLGNVTHDGQSMTLNSSPGKRLSEKISALLLRRAVDHLDGTVRNVLTGKELVHVDDAWNYLAPSRR